MYLFIFKKGNTVRHTIIAETRKEALKKLNIALRYSHTVKWEGGYQSISVKELGQDDYF